MTPLPCTCGVPCTGTRPLLGTRSCHHQGNGGYTPFSKCFPGFAVSPPPFSDHVMVSKVSTRRKKIQQGMMGYLLINSITNKSKALASFVLMKWLAQDEQNKGN